MACTAITPSRFKVLKPSFAAVADATVQTYIDLAQLWATDWDDDLCEPVQAAVTCHLMTLDGLGTSADAAAMASGEGEYQTIKTGAVSLTRFRSMAEGAGQSTSDWFAQTACGRQFLVYVRMMKGGPRAAIGCNPLHVSGYAKDAYRDSWWP